MGGWGDGGMGGWGDGGMGGWGDGGMGGWGDGGMGGWGDGGMGGWEREGDGGMGGWGGFVFGQTSLEVEQVPPKNWLMGMRTKTSGLCKYTCEERWIFGVGVAWSIQAGPMKGLLVRGLGEVLAFPQTKAFLLSLEPLQETGSFVVAPFAFMLPCVVFCGHYWCRCFLHDHCWFYVAMSAFLWPCLVFVERSSPLPLSADAWNFGQTALAFMTQVGPSLANTCQHFHLLKNMLLFPGILHYWNHVHLFSRDVSKWKKTMVSTIVVGKSVGFLSPLRL